MTFASRLAPFFREVLPEVETSNCGLKARPVQLVTWNGVATVTRAPSLLDSVPSTAVRAQLVGFNVNPGLSTVTFTTLNCSGIPSSSVGSGSLVTVNAAVRGSMLMAARTTTVPCPVVPASVYGPATAGTTILNPNGAPLYDSVRNTWPPVTRNGVWPGPVKTCVWPIRLSGPHAPCAACGSLHSGMPDSDPSTPGGICICNPFKNSSPSCRPKETVNGLYSPAWMFVVPATNEGLNRGAMQPSFISKV